MSCREAKHTKYCLFSLSRPGEWKLDRVPRRIGTAQCLQTSEGAIQDHKSLQSRAPEQYSSKGTLRSKMCRATHKVEGQDVHCRQWCFSACDGSKFLYFAAKSCLEIQTANGINRSTQERKVHIQELVEESSSVLSLGRLYDELGYSSSWQPGESPKFTKWKKTIECCTENLWYSSLRSQSNRLLHLWIRFLASTTPPKETLCPKNEVEERICLLLEPFRRRYDDDAAQVRKSPPMKPIAGRNPFAIPLGCDRCGRRQSRSSQKGRRNWEKTEPTIPNQEEITTCTKTMRARCEKQPRVIHMCNEHFTTCHDRAREMAKKMQETKEAIASMDEEKDHIAKRLAEKVCSSTFRPKTEHHKLISEAQAKLRTCVARSIPCIPTEGARGTYSPADFLPLKKNLNRC